MKACIACAENIQDAARLCKHCGTKQDDRSFASSGGDPESSSTSIVTAPLTSGSGVKQATDKSQKSSASAFVKSKLGNRNLLVLGAVVGILAIIASLWVVLTPKKKDIEISFSSADDFTFSADCKPILKGSQSLEDAVQLIFSSADGSGDNAYSPIAGRWGAGSEENCLFAGSVDVPSNAETFSVKFAGANGEKVVADRLLVDANAEKIALSADVTEFVTISGTLDLNVEVSNSTFVDCISDLAFISGGECGSLKMPTIGTCSGTGGYSDIGSGSVIRISTDNDEELGIGRLELGEGGTLLDWDSSDSGWETTCVFRWAVEVPKINGDYRVGITDRGERSYSYAELETEKWIVSLTLG